LAMIMVPSLNGYWEHLISLSRLVALRLGADIRLIHWLVLEEYSSAGASSAMAYPRGR